MDCLGALLTDELHNSKWTDQEVGFAFGRNVPIVPVKLKEYPYGFMGKYQALSCKWDTAAEEIPKILIKQDRMLDAYITAIRSCPSFADGNTISRLLPFIEKLSEKQLSEIVVAYNESGQAKFSYGFNGKSSSSYGLGLPYHLNRLTGKSYRLTKDGNITL